MSTRRPPLVTSLWGVVTGPPMLAAALAGVAWLAGIHGTDEAGQVFRVVEVREHGLSLFDPGWYGGFYPLSYSVAFPVLGALIGLAASSVVLCTFAAWAFDRLVTGFLGHRSIGSWYFAASTMLQVAIGQLPFLAGEAFGLAAVLALTVRRRWLAVGLGVGSALCSPLAAAFLAMACLAWALPGWRARLRATRAQHGGGRRPSIAGGPGWWPLGMAVAAMAVVGVLSLAFPGDGYFPFPWTELVVVEALCLAVLSPLMRTTPAVRMAVGLYALASLVSFVVPNPLGGNAGRLASAVGVPLLACFATAPGATRLSVARRLRVGRVLSLEQRWRPYAVVAVIPFAVWQWAPGLSAVRSAHDAAATTRAYYTPLLDRLADVPPARTRVEIVPTAEHWESAYVATTDLSLARGWERQIDTARNPIFYTPGALTASSYRQWLLANGISWVALPDLPAAQLDYAAVAEARLLRTGTVPGLKLVWHSADWTLWKVAGSPGLVTGPATLESVDTDTVELTATAPGTITVRLRWTPYWTIPAGTGCVTEAPDSWTELVAAHPGPVAMHASLTPERGPDCTPPG